MSFFKTYSLHTEEVKSLQKEIAASHSPLSLQPTDMSNTMRNGEYKKNALHLDLSSLNKVLGIDPEKKWVDVEPRMPFADLCQITLGYGLIPPVVPEFPSITVGGAVMGAAIESSSLRFGQVNDNCLEYELILGNGELITCSSHEHPDLFYALSGSYGTLGTLTRVKMNLIKAQPYVHLNYHVFDHLPQALSTLTSSQFAGFVEGIVFKRNHITVVTAELSSTAGTPLVKRGYSSEWYYQHVQKQPHHFREWMTLTDYLFRHDRGAFWMGRFLTSFSLLLRVFLNLRLKKIDFRKKEFPPPGSFFRFLFGWAFSSQRLYKLWHRVPSAIAEKLFFIHDFYAPISQAEQALTHFLNQTEIYPVWLCPVRATQTPQFLSPHFGRENFINMGLYGVPHSLKPIPQLTTTLERDILQFGGRKMLYSLTYYDQPLFDQIYAKDTYDALRDKFHATNAYPSLYQKVCRK